MKVKIFTAKSANSVRVDKKFESESAFEKALFAAESAGKFNELPLNLLGNRQLERIAQRTTDEATRKAANYYLEMGQKEQREKVDAAKQLRKLLNEIDDLEKIAMEGGTTYGHTRRALDEVARKFEQMENIAESYGIRVYDYRDPAQWFLGGDAYNQTEYRRRQRGNPKMSKYSTNPRLRRQLEEKMDRLRAEHTLGGKPSFEFTDSDIIEKFEKYSPETMEKLRTKIHQFGDSIRRHDNRSLYGRN